MDKCDENLLIRPCLTFSINIDGRKSVTVILLFYGRRRCAMSLGQGSYRMMSMFGLFMRWKPPCNNVCTVIFKQTQARTYNVSFLKQIIISHMHPRTHRQVCWVMVSLIMEKSMGRILKMNFSDRNLKGQVIFCIRVVLCPLFFGGVGETFTYRFYDS